MSIIPSIERVFIKWESSEKSLLIIMMNRQGQVNRLGSGEFEDDRRLIAMGTADPDLFTQLMKGLREEWFDWTGRYTFPDPKGEIHTLLLTFEGVDWETGIEFTFGIESDGPPGDIWEFVDLAVSLTDEWYEAQQKPTNR